MKAFVIKAGDMHSHWNHWYGRANGIRSSPGILRLSIILHCISACTSRDAATLN